MLLFNYSGYIGFEERYEFKNILCYCSTQNLIEKEWRINNLKTSYVIVQLY